MSAEALRRRMAHGNVYAPEKVDAALSNYFRIGNLTALRELALLWVAGKVDEQLDRYRADHGIAGTWEARERVVVALTGGPEGDTLDTPGGQDRGQDQGRRPARRPRHQVRRPDRGGSGAPGPAARAGGEPGRHLPPGRRRRRTRARCWTSRRGVNATQLVLGASRRGRFAQIFSRGVGVTATAMSGSIDVHMITHDEVATGVGGLASRRRGRAVHPQAQAGRLAVAAPSGCRCSPACWSRSRDDLSLPSEILLFLLMVVGVALLGGMWPAVTAAIAGSVLLNCYFTPPLHTLTIYDPENLLALVRLRPGRRCGQRGRRPGRRAARGRQRRPERGRRGAVHAGRPRPAGRGGAALPAGPAAGDLRARPRSRCWNGGPTGPRRPVGTRRRGGSSPPRAARRAPARRMPTPTWSSTRSSCSSPAAGCWRPTDRRVLEAFAAEAAVALRQERLREAAEHAEPLAEAATGCAPRCSPRSATTCAPRSPRPRPRWRACATTRWRGPRRTGRNCCHRRRVPGQARPAGRQPAGHEPPAGRGARGCAQPTSAARRSCPARSGVSARWPEGARSRSPVDLPDVLADPACWSGSWSTSVQRGALQPGRRAGPRHGQRARRPRRDPGDRPRAGHPGGVIERMFLPFQRLGDRDNHTGVGLGLALSRGLAEAMGGTLIPEETPGEVSPWCSPCPRPLRGPIASRPIAEVWS